MINMVTRTLAVLIFVVILSFVMFFLSGFHFLASAQEGSNLSKSDETLSVILVIDVSGSMRRTDPDNLREEAAKVMVDMSGSKDYVGVVIFNSHARTVISLQTAGDLANKELIKAMLTGELEPGGNTNFVAAFEEVKSQFDNASYTEESEASHKDDGVREVVVFMTDGDPNPDSARRDEPGFMDAHMEKVWELVHGFEKKDIPVYTVGFGEVENKELLEEISKTTGGESYYLQDSQAQAVSVYNIMRELNGNMLPYQEEFDLSIKEHEGSIDGGDLKKDDISLEESGLKFITDLYLEDVYPVGEEIMVTAFLTIRGNMLMEGRNLEIDKFDLVLEEKEEVRYFSFNDEGEKRDRKAGDGIWTSSAMLEKEGEYELSILLEGSYQGKDFKFEKNFGEFNVASPGDLMVSFDNNPFWGVAGRTVNIPLVIENNSLFGTELHVTHSLGENSDASSHNEYNTNSDTGETWYVNERINITPGDKKQAQIPINIPEDKETGIHIVPLQLATDGKSEITFPKGMEANPTGHEVEIMVASFPAVIGHNFLSLFKQNLAVLVISSMSVGFIAVYTIGGMFYYKKNVKPLTGLHGRLKYKVKNSDEKSRSNYVEEINLGELNSDVFTICFEVNGKKAEGCNLEGCNLKKGKVLEDAIKTGKSRGSLSLYNLDNLDNNVGSQYQLVFEPKSGIDTDATIEKLPKLKIFSKGWKSLLRKEPHSRMVLHCTPPGMLKLKHGKQCTKKELFHNDTFMSAGYVFLYQDE